MRLRMLPVVRGCEPICLSTDQWQEPRETASIQARERPGIRQPPPGGAPLAYGGQCSTGGLHPSKFDV